MYLLGYDVGSSSVKASLVNAATGQSMASDFFPKQEMAMNALKPGWAEQDPELWWQSLLMATASVLAKSGVDKERIRAIGIAYQMHGLVMVDKNLTRIRPAIIWCDSRAVPYGDHAAEQLGAEECNTHLLNSPGNFTASKLAWIKENEPDLYKKIYKIMLPGDYIAMKMTGVPQTTIPGLSEGIFWDFKRGAVSDNLMNCFGFDKSLLCDVVPTMSKQAGLTEESARLLGLVPGTPVSYRAGDQTNNALSLNVFQPGEVASTAGTSGTIYGVLDKLTSDPLNRVNIFAHVNHTAEAPRLGMLLCINGAGRLYAWLRTQMIADGMSYDVLNMIASSIPIGCNGVSVLPFGNGAERVLGNRDIAASFNGINFNVHSKADLLRASHEGIVFSMKYGLDIMTKLGLKVDTIRVGNANMYKSDIFRETMAGVTEKVIEIYETDGAAGAAKGAGIGAGIYADSDEAFATLDRSEVVEPKVADIPAYKEAYARWKELLERSLKA